MATSRRKRNRGSRGADTLFGYLIPGFLVVSAAYQQITTGAIDKYVIGSLLVFGLGALGWRLDVLFESYMRARYGSPQTSPSNDNDDTENSHE